MAEMSPTTLRVLCTLTIAAPMRELAERFHQSTGIALDLSLDPTALLVQAITSGAEADVAVLTREEVDRLSGERTLVAGSGTDLVRSFVGLGAKTGAPKPQINTVEEFVAMLHNARSIAYSQAGASGLFFAELLERLGIADEVNAKATIVPRGFTGDQVTNGTVEFAVQQVSELMNVPGVDVVGRFPTAIGRDAVFSAGILAASARKTEAAEFIRFLASTDVAPVMERFGLESMSG